MLKNHNCQSEIYASFLVMCTEIVSLCANLTGKIDPAAVAMLAYVRDDILAENTNWSCNSATAQLFNQIRLVERAEERLCSRRLLTPGVPKVTAFTFNCDIM